MAAELHGTTTARIVDVTGEVVTSTANADIGAGLDEIASDVFVLDLDDGRNRYVMTKIETLEPLLDLPRATLEIARMPSDTLSLGNVGEVAAVGVVLEDAGPLGTGWVTFDDNVLDLLPGETRTIALAGDGELVVSGWNVQEIRVPA